MVKSCHSDCASGAASITSLKQGVNNLLTPPVQILSVPVALLGPAALRQLGVMPFCVANTPRVVCASLVLGAAVPWNVYRLKIAETQSASKLIRCQHGAVQPCPWKS